MTFRLWRASAVWVVAGAACREEYVSQNILELFLCDGPLCDDRG